MGFTRLPCHPARGPVAHRGGGHARDHRTPAARGLHDHVHDLQPTSAPR